MVFTLIALAPTALTVCAVLLTLLVMALRADPTLPQEEPAVDWLALDAELDVDAAWEALYVTAMGCNRRVRCTRPTFTPRRTHKVRTVHAPTVRTPYVEYLHVVNGEARWEPHLHVG